MYTGVGWVYGKVGEGGGVRWMEFKSAVRNDREEKQADKRSSNISRCQFAFTAVFTTFRVVRTPPPSQKKALEN